MPDPIGYVLKPGRPQSVAVPTRVVGGLSRPTYRETVLATQPANLIGYWPLDEADGATVYDVSPNARHGTQTACGQGKPGIGDGAPSVRFDGSASKVSIYSALLRDALNAAEGALSLWCAMDSAAVWTDVTQRYLLYLYASSSNRIMIYKDSTAQTLALYHTAGGTSRARTATFVADDWIHLGIVWSVTGAYVQFWVNGVLVNTSAAPGTWSGTISEAWLGALNTTPQKVHQGCLAHFALWNTPLTAAEVCILARRAPR